MDRAEKERFYEYHKEKAKALLTEFWGLDRRSADGEDRAKVICGTVRLITEQVDGVLAEDQELRELYDAFLLETEGRPYLLKESKEEAARLEAEAKALIREYWTLKRDRSGSDRRRAIAIEGRLPEIARLLPHMSEGRTELAGMYFRFRLVTLGGDMEIKMHGPGMREGRARVVFGAQGELSVTQPCHNDDGPVVTGFI